MALFKISLKTPGGNLSVMQEGGSESAAIGQALSCVPGAEVLSVEGESGKPALKAPAQDKLVEPTPAPAPQAPEAAGA